MAQDEWRLECAVFNSHTSTHYVLDGTELSASSDSWAGNWDGLGRRLGSAQKHHWARAHLSISPPPSPPVEALWPNFYCFLPGERTGPCPAWWALTNGCSFERRWARLRSSVFYFPPAWLGCPFVRLGALLCCPHDGAPRGSNVCHLFYFQIKFGDLPIKKLK